MDAPQPAIHTLLLMDASSSIRSCGLLDGLISAANDALAELRAARCLVSIVYFNQDVGFAAWRLPAQDVPPFSVYNVPIDAGTRLYDAILVAVERLESEFLASHGETNADVRILIFTDGADSCSAANGMAARLALGRAMERGFSITFVSAVPGLAGDLGLSPRQTVLVSPTPVSVRDGFKRATVRMTGPMVDAAMEPPPPVTAPDPAPQMPPPSPPQPDPAPAPRPWWRFW